MTTSIKKIEGQTNINSSRVSELNINGQAYMYKIVSFVAKLIKYMILFKDVLTFLGLDYRDASLITLDLVVIGISIQRIK